MNDRTLEYLTRWRYENPNEYTALMGNVLVRDLTPEQYIALFRHVVQNDLNYLTHNGRV